MHFINVEDDVVVICKHSHTSRLCCQPGGCQTSHTYTYHIPSNDLSNAFTSPFLAVDIIADDVMLEVFSKKKLPMTNRMARGV